MEDKKEMPNISKFAIVELFTSEGCSSCPAADKLLNELYTEYKEKNIQVFCLAFHVDYWNYLGWNDDFSRKEFSQRQYRYGEIFGLQSVYTPQAIVNGATEFVGSNRSRMENAITSALSMDPQVFIDLKGCFVLADTTIKVIYSVKSLPTDGTLNFAVVERGLTREIKRGENSGKILFHDHVVRAFVQSKDQSRQDMTIIIPSGIILERASLIVFAQGQSSMKIIGASSLEIKSK